MVPEWDSKTEIDLETVRIEDVERGGVAENAGLRVGDEVTLINGTSVTELGWVEVERLATESMYNMCITSRSNKRVFTIYIQ